MPESGTKSRYVNNGKAVEPVNSHQSAWLTHWTGSRVETSTHDHLTPFSKGEGNDYELKKQSSGVEKASDNFGFSKGIKDVDLTMSLKKPGGQSFPFFKIGQQSGRTEVEAQPLNIETLSHVPTEEVKYHMFFGESSYSKDGTASPSCLPMNQRPYKAESETTEFPSFLRQKNTPFVKTDPSTSTQRSPASIEEQYKRMQKHIGMGFFPNQTASPQHIKSRPLHPGSISYQNVPQFVHDVEELAGGLHTFSRTTHSLLITKQTDVKVYQESQIFRESRVSTQLKGGALRELNFSPLHFGQGQRGPKLQLLDSSDHESQDNVESVKATGDFQKIESSADAMDMESSKNNNLSGEHLSLRNKEIMEESSLPHLPPIDTRRKSKIELPDINLEVSDVPAASNSVEKAEPCLSRTQSLDMNALQFNVDNASHSNSNECSNSNMGSEPGSRWIKRLKLNASGNLALGTKTSKLAEPSSHGKKLAEPSSHGKLKDKCHGKESESLMADSCSVDTNTKRDCDITLSHSWIQRWSRNQNQKNPEIVETDKPDDSKFTTDELQKKQFPSIAAMALMGKAMTGFQQCKFQKKESFVVWNTKGFD